MVQLSITPDTVVVELRGLEAVWSLRRRVEIPIRAITAVGPAETIARQGPRGIRLGGTAWPFGPNRFFAGSFRDFDGRWAFWYVRHPENAIWIHVADIAGTPRYREIIVEVDDPTEAAARISRALAGAGAMTSARLDPESMPGAPA